MPHEQTDDYSGSTERRIPTPNPTGFAPDISPDEWVASLRAARIKLPPAWNQPFEVLQPAHLVGRARTNTTLVDPTIVQTDVLPPFAFAPFAEFDMQRAQNKRAVVSHHFQASGYGSTGIGTFIFSFTVRHSVRRGSPSEAARSAHSSRQALWASTIRRGPLHSPPPSLTSPPTQKRPSFCSRRAGRRGDGSRQLCAHHRYWTRPLSAPEAA